MIIKKFKISNYRSLVDFELDELGSTTIFYGDNNAGKSNVLQAIQMIFKRKSKGPTSASQNENFYQGIIPDFENEFYKNDTNNIITFYIEIELSNAEVEIDNLIKKIIKKQASISIKISGQIIPQISTNGISGIFETNEVLINDTEAFTYKHEKFSYFPKILKADFSNSGELASAFENIMRPLNDCVYMIGSNRDMQVSSFEANPVTNISPRDFKNFLHTLYLSTRDYRTFELINQVFNEEPFRFGTISFSSENRNLELMIQKNNIRYPIKHLGSGVLQTLYIIASVIYSKKKIICIEELEQNLSPERQIATIEKLQAMIGKPGYTLNQLIISSHSPFLFDTKISNSIYLLKLDGEKTVVDANKEAASDKVKTKDSAQKFSDHLKVDYYKPHFPDLEDFY